MTIRPFEGNELLKLIDRLRQSFVGRDEVVWQAADVYNSATQSIAAGAAFVSLTFNTVRKDTASLYSAGTPTRLTCKVAGWYTISGQCTMAVDPGGSGIQRQIAISVNGVQESPQNYFTIATYATVMAISRVIYLNAADYVELQVQQSGAGAISTTIANKTPALQMCRYP